MHGKSYFKTMPVKRKEKPHYKCHNHLSRRYTTAYYKLPATYIAYSRLGYSPGTCNALALIAVLCRTTVGKFPVSRAPSASFPPNPTAGPRDTSVAAVDALRAPSLLTLGRDASIALEFDANASAFGLDSTGGSCAGSFCMLAAAL